MAPTLEDDVVFVGRQLRRCNLKSESDNSLSPIPKGLWAGEAFTPMTDQLEVLAKSTHDPITAYDTLGKEESFSAIERSIGEKDGAFDIYPLKSCDNTHQDEAHENVHIKHESGSNVNLGDTAVVFATVHAGHAAHDEVCAELDDLPADISDSELAIYIGLSNLQTPLSNKQRPAKSRRQAPTFDLTDSDLEQRMNDLWENDRNKKKERKMKRQELRAQGLLTKSLKHLSKNTKHNFTQGRLRSGMQEEVVRRIFDFLGSQEHQLRLPAMDSVARKQVHQLCHELNIGTKSQGRAPSRYPVLYKTKKSTRDQIHGSSTYSRKFRMRDSGNFAGRTNPISSAGRKANYRDGEIVGAAAAELAVDNKGRLMLEKMGWSSGTTLGITGDKGLQEPVSQVVKTSRLGLG